MLHGLGSSGFRVIIIGLGALGLYGYGVIGVRALGLRGLGVSRA